MDIKKVKSSIHQSVYNARKKVETAKSNHHHLDNAKEIINKTKNSITDEITNAYKTLKKDYLVDIFKSDEQGRIRTIRPTAHTIKWRSRNR